MQEIIYDLTYMPKGHTGHLCPMKEVVDAWQEFYQIFPFNNILQFGFNTGWSSALFFTMFPDINIDSIEIRNDINAQKGLKILEEKFPKKHRIVWGDSQVICKEVINGVRKLPSEKYDLAFIDGDHSAAVVENDIKLSLHLGIKNFVFDDTQLPEIDFLLKKFQKLKLITEKVYFATKYKHRGYKFSGNKITIGYYQTI